MKDCIFCKIINRKIPSVEIFEDELVFAFMDIAPINKGHILLIPREHHKSASTIPGDTAGRIFSLASRIGVALKRSEKAEGFNLHLADGECAGQVVMHAHMHIIPRWIDDGFHWNWRQLEYKNDNEKHTMADSIKKYLKI